jgi:hypothetical protein
MSQPKKRDSVWWGSLILVIYGVAHAVTMVLMMTTYLSNPLIPEEEAQLGSTFAQIQVTNPYLAKYIWWIINAWVLPYALLLTLVVIPLAWKAVKKRQKWAWYTILTIEIPFWLLFYAVCIHLHTNWVQHWLIFTPFFILFLIGMILPARQILAPKNAEGKA